MGSSRLSHFFAKLARPSQTHMDISLAPRSFFIPGCGASIFILAKARRDTNLPENKKLNPRTRRVDGGSGAFHLSPRLFTPQPIDDEPTMFSKLLTASILAISFVALPSIALAQDATASQQEDAPAGIVLEESVIKGRLQKPEAFYFLKNQELGWQKVDHQRSFIVGIERTIKQDPF